MDKQEALKMAVDALTQKLEGLNPLHDRDVVFKIYQAVDLLSEIDDRDEVVKIDNSCPEFANYSRCAPEITKRMGKPTVQFYEDLYHFYCRHQILDKILAIGGIRILKEYGELIFSAYPKLKELKHATVGEAETSFLGQFFQNQKDWMVKYNKQQPDPLTNGLIRTSHNPELMSLK